MSQMDSNLLVYKASAGSGKTYILTKEYVYLLFKNPNNFRHILAVTFTNKACAEMKHRIVETLYDLSLAEPKNKSFAAELMQDFALTPIQCKQKAEDILHAILHNYSFFYIETIDSFFQRVIRNFAKELGLNSYFSLELDTAKVLHEALKQLFIDLGEHPEIQKWLVEYSNIKIEEGKNRNIFSVIEKETSILFSEAYVTQSKEPLSIAQLLELFIQVDADIVLFETKLQEQAEAALRCIEHNDLELTDFSGGSKSFIHVLLKILDGDYDIPTDSVLEKCKSSDKWFAKKAKLDDKIALLCAMGFDANLLTICNLLEGIEGKKYRTAKEIVKQKYVLGLMQIVQEKIDDYCKDEGLFLISNTNQLLRDIIQDNDAPFVYEKIGCYLKYIMIDEFQDTSNLQWQNFKPLIQNAIGEGGMALVVGDIKQAIYRFRNGDWRLLHTKLQEEFGSQITEIALQNNWRSKKNIIDFNNTFIQLAVSVMQQSFNAKAQEHAIPLEASVSECMSNIYETLTQEYAPSTQEGGIVKLELIEASIVAEYNAAVLEKVVAQVIELFEKGYKPQDIVFLTRYRKDIGYIVDYFSKKKLEYPEYEDAFSIVSNESMLLNSSYAVQFIVAYLQWLDKPSDMFARTFLVLQYAQWHKASEEFDMSQLQEYEHVIGEFPKISHTSSLYSLVESIIYEFCLHEFPEELAFIVDFQNIIFSYSKNNTVAISQFLEWWQEHKEKLYLKQEAEGYMRAMTIHKSKGLQFPVVIMPYANWAFTQKNSKALYSCDSTDYNGMPTMQLQHSDKLAQTQFNMQYIYEELQICVENLNLLYVACTRAEEGLFMYSSIKATKSTLSAIIKPCLELLQSPTENEESSPIYTLGVLDAKVQKEKSAVSSILETNYPLSVFNQVLLPNPEAIEFFDITHETNREKIYGICMHSILEHIHTINDIESAVDTIIRKGVLDTPQKAEFTNFITKALASKNVEDWFSGIYNILTEQTIITPTANKRPDRIMLLNNTAIVVDYKFTEHMQEKHTYQVQEYVDILTKMGYQTTGFVWYVMKNIVVEV